MIARSYQIKPEAKDAIERLHAAGIGTALVSGDNQAAALWAVQQADIKEVAAEVMPKDKINQVKNDLKDVDRAVRSEKKPFPP